MASCKGSNGTVTERKGIDTAYETMRGIVPKADLQERYERNLGGVTTQYGGKHTKARCVEVYPRNETRAVPSEDANC